MLVAHSTGGQRVLAWDAERSDGYACPECAAPVVVKQGAIVIEHFAHRSDESCGYSDGESYRHIYMKYQLTRWWDGVELEVPGIASDRRADAVLRSGGRAFVVECQASPIDVVEWESRTRDYERAGVPLLWLWNSNLLTEHHPPREYRIPAAALRDAKRRNDRLMVFVQPGQLEIWSLQVPYRGTQYIRRVTRAVLAREDDRLPLPKPWERPGVRTLWLEPPIPRELAHVAKDPVIVAAMERLDGRILSIVPDEERLAEWRDEVNRCDYPKPGPGSATA